MPTAGGGHMASEPVGSSAQHGSLGGVKADAGMPEALRVLALEETSELTTGMKTSAPIAAIAYSVPCTRAYMR